MGRRAKEPPAAFVTKRGEWPDGPFVKNAPAYVLPLAGLAGRLLELVGEGWSQRQLAAETGVNVATINHILNGSVIPDTATLAALEQGLGESLWTFS